MEIENTIGHTPHIGQDYKNPAYEEDETEMNHWPQTCNLKIPNAKIPTISGSIGNGVPNGTGIPLSQTYPRSYPGSRRPSANIESPPPKFLYPQHFSMSPTQNSCIVVEAGKKSYGKLSVLRNVHMNVKSRSIYGLLGSSGCGKTTLLSCIVGIRSLDRGRVFVFGNEPGSPESGVPGSRVGYMPQEVALNLEFTVSEVLMYFGRIFGLDHERIQDRSEYLIHLLDLRRCKGQLKNLSGGQQRRVSFAVALLHEPEILILDEPTVGVDPLLRASIWSHLRELVNDYGTTVVITTHYIEEMRSADCVGIMKDGIIFAEDSPDNLMTVHNAKMLEEVVLKFCMKPSQSKGRKKKKHPLISQEDQAPDIQDPITFAQINRIRTSVCLFEAPLPRNEDCSSPSPLPASPQWRLPMPRSVAEDDEDLESEPGKKNQYQTSKFNILRALVLKNVLVIMRNIWFLVFMVLMPGVVTAVFCWAIGPEPENLPIGIINQDISGGICPNPVTPSCKGLNLSCLFIEKLDTSLVELVTVKDETEALKLVDDRKIWGYIKFNQGFSKGIFEKIFRKAAKVSFETNGTDFSQVEVRLDLTSYSLAQLLRKNVFDAYISFTKALSKSCQGPTAEQAEAESLPINFKEPIYGTYDGEYTDFIALGIGLGFIFFLAVITCGLAAITEKKDGMFNRCLVAGVTTLQIMVSHLITQFGIIFVQSCVVFVVLFTMFDVPAEGSIPLAFLLMILLNVAGMSLGLLFSTLFDEEKNAMLVGFAAVLPNYLLAGLIWPFEGLPPALRGVGYGLPTYLAAESFRSILLRGWGMEYFTVWVGFLATVGWIVGAWGLLLLIQTFKHKK